MSNLFEYCEPAYEFKYEATREELEKLIVMERLYLYNGMRPCGAKALQNRLKAQGIKNVPSVSTISGLLTKNSLTHARTGCYPGDQT